MKLLALALLVCGLPCTAMGQTAVALAPTRSILFEVEHPSPFDSASAAAAGAYPETHWKEGAIVGGVLVGLLGAGVAEGLCHYGGVSGSCAGSLVIGAVVGGLLGATIGALIGGQFPK